MDRQRSLRSRLVATALVGPLALASSACNPSADSAVVAGDTDTDTDTDTVMVEHMDYTPESVTVPVDATVTWIFDDGAILHDVVFDDVDTASELIADGTFRHVFTEPGAYTYHCSLHPNMTGTIEVTS